MKISWDGTPTNLNLKYNETQKELTALFLISLTTE